MELCIMKVDRQEAGNGRDGYWGQKPYLKKLWLVSKDIDISSIEIKKPMASPSLVLEQQCKNLRSNGAILGHLQAVNSSKNFDHIVAMDWIGMVDYMYLLADIDHDYFGGNRNR
ncbi:unnamed protein product [Absidia cylindrospora]